MAERFGLSSLEELLPLFRQQQVYFPTWWIVRALALTSAFASASEVAEAALGIARIFRETRGNEQIRRSELEAVAGTIWGCEPERTVREGRRRGLFENDGYSPGLWQALEMLAPAERARTPLAGYAGKRAALIAVTLHDPLGKTLPPLPPLPPIGAKSGVFRRTLPSEGPARSTEPGHLSASNASSSGEIP